MRVAIYGALIFLGVLLLSLPLAVPVIKTSARYSIFNPGLDGCSEFAKLLYKHGEVIPIMYPLNNVNLPKLSGTLIIIRPDMPYTKIEAKYVESFVKNGGTLFIADNYGTANMLLSELNVSARFANKKLFDLFYSKNENFPVVVRILDPALKKGVNYLILDSPTVILGANGEIYTSKISTIGGKERSFPIMTVIKYGHGRIILFSDPNVLTNNMFRVDRNFIVNLVSFLGTGPFYVDEAHHSDFNPYSSATVFIHQRLTKEKILEVFLVVSAIAAFARSGLLDKIIKKISFKEKRENYLSDLPEWVDRDKLEKMLEEMKVGSKIKVEVNK